MVRWWAVVVRGPPCSSSNESRRRSSISWTLSMRAQAAASSRARGGRPAGDRWTPSRRPHRARPAVRLGRARLARGTAGPRRSRGRARRRMRRWRSGSVIDGTTYTASPGTPSGSRLVARRRELLAVGEQSMGQPGCRFDDVLAVVEHEQGPAWPEPVDERLHRSAGLGAASRRDATATALAMPASSVTVTSSTNHTPSGASLAVAATWAASRRLASSADTGEGHDP